MYISIGMVKLIYTFSKKNLQEVKFELFKGFFKQVYFIKLQILRLIK